MANMNLPGVRRIEALIAVLKTKEKEEIAALNTTLPTRSQIIEEVDAEFGVSVLREKIHESITAANEAYALLNEVTGEAGLVKKDYEYRRRMSSSDYHKRVDELVKLRIDSVIDEVKRKFKEKESDLWLVESIEEAKAIVYGTPVQK